MAKTILATTRRTQPSDLLAAALFYAGHGWPVFMLGRSKRPVANCGDCRTAGPGHDLEACPCMMCHGLYAATTDPSRIRAMRRASPRGLLAIRTGSISGLVVIDIDPEHGGQITPALMPRTGYVRTGSGGLHLYYRHPGAHVPNSQSRLAPGVDVRGDGGYVVAPPSVHPRTRRAYLPMVGHPAEMPPGLVVACLPPEPAVPSMVTARATSTRAAGGITSPEALLAALIATVRAAPEGRRRTTLYGAARGVARMVAAGALSAPDAYEVLADVGRAAGQTERETRSAIVGGFRDEGLSA